MIKINNLICMFILFFTHLCAANDPIAHLYASLFGTSDASNYYKEIVQQACADFGKKSTTLSIKKMNTLADRLIGAQLYAFTLYKAIWLNEEALKEIEALYGKDIVVWIIYHEVAHYILNHHAKAVFLYAIFSTATLGIGYYFGQFYKNKLIVVSLASFFAYDAHMYIGKQYVKEQEKAADCAAIKVLYATKQCHIINALMQYLLLLIAEGRGAETDGWHYSLQEQYNYCCSTYASLK